RPDPQPPPRAPNLACPFSIPHSAFRIRLSPNLLELSRVRLVTVTQSEVPIQPRRPRPRALGPLDQHDSPVAHHVVERQIPGFGRRPEAVAVDVVDQPVIGRSV